MNGQHSQWVFFSYVQAYPKLIMISPKMIINAPDVIINTPKVIIVFFDRPEIGLHWVSSDQKNGSIPALIV